MAGAHPRDGSSGSHYYLFYNSSTFFFEKTIQMEMRSKLKLTCDKYDIIKKT